MVRLNGALQSAITCSGSGGHPNHNVIIEVQQIEPDTYSLHLVGTFDSIIQSDAYTRQYCGVPFFEWRQGRALVITETITNAEGIVRHRLECR